MKRSRSDRKLPLRRESARLGLGATGSQAIRAAAGGPRTRDCRPYTASEVLAAAQLIASEHGLPVALLRVGIALDLMCGTDRMTRARLRSIVKLQIEAIAMHERLWELIDQMERFEIDRRAVQIIHARRTAARSR